MSTTITPFLRLMKPPFDSVSTQLYIRYNDGDSLQWVAVANVSANVPEAPNDGEIYGRQNGRWVRIP